MYAQPDKKKVRTKSSSLLSKSHDNLYAQPEERDVHAPLTSFASSDLLRKSHDHLYDELEEGKASKASKESTSRESIKSGKPQTHEYAELEESAQPSLPSPQTSRASLKSRKPQAHEYAELEESAQPSSLSSQTSRASLKSKVQHAHVYAQLEEGEMCAQPSPLPPEELLYAEPEERRATKKCLTLPHAQPKGKPHARLYSQVEERDMQTQLSSLPPEELLYAKPEERKATKKLLNTPATERWKTTSSLVRSARGEGGKQRTCYSTHNTCVQYTARQPVFSNRGEKSSDEISILLSYRKSHDDRFTQLEERETRMQPIPSDRPQDHLYAQPDRKKVRTKSSSLFSKSHDNLYAQPEERDVHRPLTLIICFSRSIEEISRPPLCRAGREKR